MEYGTSFQDSYILSDTFKGGAARKGKVDVSVISLKYGRNPSGHAATGRS